MTNKRKKQDDSTLSINNMLSGNNTAVLTEAEQLEYVNKILQQSMSRFKHKIDREYVDYKEDIDCLQNIVLEYLDDFIIIGHTPDDRRVVMRYAQTPKTYDALKELSREFLIRMMMSDKIEME